MHGPVGGSAVWPPATCHGQDHDKSRHVGKEVATGVNNITTISDLKSDDLSTWDALMRSPNCRNVSRHVVAAYVSELS